MTAPQPDPASDPDATPDDVGSLAPTLTETGAATTSTPGPATTPDPHPERGAHTAGRRAQRRGGVVIGAVVAVLVVALVAVGTLLGGPEAPPTPAPSPVPTAGQRGAYPSFGPQDVFRVDLTGAPVAKNSAAMIANLRGQIEPHYGGIAGLNISRYNPSLYVVDAATPRHDIAFDDCQKKGHTPAGLLDGPAYFRNVPVPDDALTSVGTDSTLTLWSPSTDQLWEFWVMKRRSGGWSACWGGRIDHVSTSPGYFPSPFGVSASGLVTTGSMVTIEEARAGRIDHAVGMALIYPANWDRFSYPAQRSDGGDKAPNAVPEGSRLRLDPTLDVDALHLTPLATAIAKAAQRYGFVVVDTAGSVSVMAESGLPEKQLTGKDPWDEILRGVPDYKQLENFPWDRVQVIAPDYGKP